MKFTITIDVPDGSIINTEVEQQADSVQVAIPPDVVARIEQLVPSRFRKNVFEYVRRSVDELGCEVVVPDSDRRDEYFNIYPPARCRRARVAGVTYSSSRTAVYAGAIDLDGFILAEQTLNSGVYAYPKLPHLESHEAVEEALHLTQIAIKRVER